MRIVCFYCLCEDLLRAIGHKDDPQTKMSTAEVMTLALISVEMFGGNYELTRLHCKQHKYFEFILSQSRFIRRLHAIPMQYWEALFHFLGEIFKSGNIEQEYIVDSFPVSSCDTSRIFKTKLYSGKEYKGYMSSKSRYFYGMRVHMLVTAGGKPVEYIIAPGSHSDIRTFWKFNLNIPCGSKVFADGAYNDYLLEDIMKESEGIRLCPQRKKNSVRQFCTNFKQEIRKKRKMVETAFSQIT